MYFRGRLDLSGGAVAMHGGSLAAGRVGRARARESCGRRGRQGGDLSAVAVAKERARRLIADAFIITKDEADHEALVGQIAEVILEAEQTALARSQHKPGLSLGELIGMYGVREAEFEALCERLGLPPCSASFTSISAVLDAAMEQVCCHAAVAQERVRWVKHLDAALREESDTARSDLNHEWWARIQAAVAPRIALAVEAEREACRAMIEAMVEAGDEPVEGHTCCMEILRRLRARAAP